MDVFLIVFYMDNTNSDEVLPLETNKHPGANAFQCLFLPMSLFLVCLPNTHTQYYLLSHCLDAFVLADDFIIKEPKQQALSHSHSSSHTLH